MAKLCPGLGGPIGERDFAGGEGRRVKFLLGQAPRLDDLGAVPMFELKGDDLSGDWVGRVYDLLKPFGGRLLWHPSQKSTRTLHQGVSPELERIAGQANQLRQKFGLAAVTIHCAPAAFREPSPDEGWERYNSPIGAGEMLAHIQAQVEPLKQLNELMGGILHIETVDIANFASGGCRLPTYLALQTGAWDDLDRLSRKTGCSITYDSEHQMCAGNLLYRRRDLAGLPEWEVGDPSDDEYELQRIAGYWLRKGLPPAGVPDDDPRDPYFTDFDALRRARLIHLGAAEQATVAGKYLGTHLPWDQNKPEQMELLKGYIRWGLRRSENEGFLGWIDEVVGGKTDPAKYDPWSPRPEDDEDAKEQSLLAEVAMLERVRAEG